MRDKDGYNLSQIEDCEKYKVMMLKVFGRNIKNFRLKREMTQEQLAELAGIACNYLGEIERGEKNPTALVVYKLSRALKVPVSKILSDNNNPFINEKYLEEVEKLFEGKRKTDIEKAIKILEILFK
jgi:transcriptional regulator with XRE-family HTH domain